jgi:hypothetical protein
LVSYYNREGQTYLIEIRLIDARQLFNSLDPSPFLERDLDDNAETYIVQAIQEFSLQTSLKLVFYLPEPAWREAKRILPEAIHNYFRYRRHNATQELRQMLRQGRTSLLIGLVDFIGNSREG